MTTTTSAWSIATPSVLRARLIDREVRITDFMLCIVLPFRSLDVGGLPVGELAMLALLGLMLFRRPVGHAGTPAVIVLGVTGLLGFLLFSGFANDVDWTKRMGHMSIWAGLIWGGATGRLSLRSAGMGLGAGLTAAAGLALLGVGPDNYEGRLTGLLGDPNAGAYFIVTLGLLAVGFVDERRKLQAVAALPIVAALILTYSRTGLLAVAFALLWWAFGRRLGTLGGIAAVAALVWIVDNIPDDVVLFGPFSNRSGSDALRDRIIEQEYESLSIAPWYGHGPGTAKVVVDGSEFFFHNSYLAARQEGGWLALALVLVVIAYAFMRLSPAARAGDLPSIAAQSSLISVVVMSATLGEVLLDLPAAFAIAFTLGRRLQLDHAVREGRTHIGPERPDDPPAQPAPLNWPVSGETAS